MLKYQLEKLALAARRLRNAITAVEAVEKAAKAQLDSHPEGTDPELLLAYHSAWCEMSEARQAFISMPRPVGEDLRREARQNRPMPPEDDRPGRKARSVWALLDEAWGIIANAGEGDWAREGADWQNAAARWRDDYDRATSQQRTLRRATTLRDDTEAI